MASDWTHDCKGCAYEWKPYNFPTCEKCDDKSEHTGMTKTINAVDNINRPSHYMLFDGIEVRDVIEKLVEKVAKKIGQGEIPYSPLFEADYVQLMQYLMRFMSKNGVEDLKKARWYLDKMIQAYEAVEAYEHDIK